MTALALIAAVPLAACSSPTHEAGDKPATTAEPGAQLPTRSVPATTTVQSPSTTTTSSVVGASAPGGGAGTCTFSELTIAAGTTGAGLGHIGGPLLFTNTGTAECSLSGYPGVAGLDAAGRQVVQARRALSGYLGGLWTGAASPPTVDLAPGGTASALVEGTDEPFGTPPPASCPRYDRLLVTPPTATQSVQVAMSLPGCSGLEVHPVVPGTSGRST